MIHKKKPMFLILILITIIIFSAVAINELNQTAAEGNPYKKETLHPATIQQLDDPIYKNIMLPEELEATLESNDSAYVYFYSPTCSFCKKTTPIVVPMAEEMGIDLSLFNILEFNEGWETYKIEGTPTIIYFENGKEVSRIEGGVDAEKFKKWFEEMKGEY